MIDLETKVYKTIAHSHYGAWPRLEEIIETYNLEKDIEEELTRQIAEKIEEEKKMKNIKWTNSTTYYDTALEHIEVRLRAEIPDDVFLGRRSDIGEYVRMKANSDNENLRPRVTTTTYHPDRIIPEIKDVIFSGPATIVLWKDGTKTVVKAQEGEIIDYEKGMAMAIAKRMLGNKGSYYDTFTKYLPKEDAE